MATRRAMPADSASCARLLTAGQLLLVVSWFTQLQHRGAAAGAAASGGPDPVIGWPASPFADLPALPKTHLTWSLGGVPYNASSPTVVDYARITHSLPIRLPLHGDSATFKIQGADARQVLEAVKICAATNASLNLNWSPWSLPAPPFNPSGTPPPPMPHATAAGRLPGPGPGFSQRTQD